MPLVLVHSMPSAVALMVIRSFIISRRTTPSPKEFFKGFLSLVTSESLGLSSGTLDKEAKMTASRKTC